jgi:hypothetical protein
MSELEPQEVSVVARFALATDDLDAANAAWDQVVQFAATAGFTLDNSPLDPGWSTGGPTREEVISALHAQQPYILPPGDEWGEWQLSMWDAAATSIRISDYRAAQAIVDVLARAHQSVYARMLDGDWAPAEDLPDVQARLKLHSEGELPPDDYLASVQ